MSTDGKFAATLSIGVVIVIIGIIVALLAAGNVLNFTTGLAAGGVVALIGLAAIGYSLFGGRTSQPN